MHSLLDKINYVAIAKDRTHNTRVRLRHVSRHLIIRNRRNLMTRLNATVLEQHDISDCFRISMPDWAYLLPSIIIELGL